MHPSHVTRLSHQDNDPSDFGCCFYTRPPHAAQLILLHRSSMVPRAPSTLYPLLDAFLAHLRITSDAEHGDLETSRGQRLDGRAWFPTSLPIPVCHFRFFDFFVGQSAQRGSTNASVSWRIAEPCCLHMSNTRLPYLLSRDEDSTATSGLIVCSLVVHPRPSSVCVGPWT